MDFLPHLLATGLSTITDVLPIAGIIFGFQLLVLRQNIPHLKSVLVGFVYVLIGLTLFLVGLEEALFPLGKLMAEQLTDPAFIRSTAHVVGDSLQWNDYKWIYLFAAAIGFSTTIAEPALIAVAIKASAMPGATATIEVERRWHRTVERCTGAWDHGHLVNSQAVAEHVYGRLIDAHAGEIVERVTCFLGEPLI